MQRIKVTSIDILTSAGANLEENWDALKTGLPKLDTAHGKHAALINATTEAKLSELSKQKKWRNTDRAVLLGVLAARQASAKIKNNEFNGEGYGVVFGSSRGATQKLENEHRKYLNGEKIALTTSPETTSGAFASAIVRDLGATEISLFVSSACSTSLNALGVGISLIKSGQTKKMIVGAAEASVSDFTLTQLSQLGIYLNSNSSDQYCYRPFHPERSGIAIGEGAGCAILEGAEDSDLVSGDIVISGFGSASEHATLTGVSKNGDCLVAAIKKALSDSELELSDIDFIVAHGAGTKRGDPAELKAYERFFGDSLPPMTCHKWLFGHLLGAAAISSLGLAVKHMENGFLPAIPYLENTKSLVGRPTRSKKFKHALVTALGFGGNASAAIISKR